ncbi:MAG: glycosyltransferase [Gammaproteobacteria bacterium]|nr:glycosyltransferase [Gammaproteobacteria bacterium]
MSHQSCGLYIVLISVHGLIRGKNLELGRDADTGGQTLYVVELARALAQLPAVGRVDLVTRRVVDPQVAEDYGEPLEELGPTAKIVRISAGPDGYIAKEQIWDHLDSFVDNTVEYLRAQARPPDVVHSHYADAGYVGSSVAHQLGIPLIHTGHSLGRVKQLRLLASGLSHDDIENRYCMRRRIDAEEQTLAAAERVITSTRQEIQEQYELYDHYQPEQMRVIPPGTDVQKFVPVQGDEYSSDIYSELCRFLRAPEKPIILALSRADRRKNIVALLEAYGQSPQLQQYANLVIVAGNRDDIDDLDAGAQEFFRELLVCMDRYDLYGKIALPKHHQRNDVSMFYRLAASSGGVFVNPALTEPFGLTLIEAAASGLPIVATEDGGPKDIIGNCGNGILIDPLDTLTISNALIRLLGDKKYWQHCAKNGMSGVTEHYSWLAHAQSYLKLLQPLLAGTETLQRRPAVRRTELYRDRAIFSDIDQNLLGDKDSLQQLIQLLRIRRKDAVFGIATGRRLDSALRIMRSHGIPEPDILITSCGTEIYYAPELTADELWFKHIDYRWTPQVVRRLLDGLPGLRLQAKNEQSRYKVSFYYDSSIAPPMEEIQGLIHQEDLAVNINIAFGQFLDITPIRASKGMALRYAANRWQIPLNHVFVAGGSGADEDMMRGNTLAAVIANRHHEELSQLADNRNIYFARQAFAAGILESLEHYDFFNSCRAAEPMTL